MKPLGTVVRVALTILLLPVEVVKAGGRVGEAIKQGSKAWRL